MRRLEETRKESERQVTSQRKHLIVSHRALSTSMDRHEITPGIYDDEWDMQNLIKDIRNELKLIDA
jgi:tRNA pseudouridine-54 N-methylase